MSGEFDPEAYELFLKMQTLISSGQPPADDLDVKPWDEPVALATILDAIVERFNHYISALSDGIAEAVALYVPFTYAIDHTIYAPRLLLKSPVRGCGKSTFIDILGQLVRRPEILLSISRAEMLHILDEEQRVLLLDEADYSVKGHKALFAILNGGWYRPTAYLRQRDRGHGRRYCVYGPVIFGAIGNLLDSLEDRCIIVELEAETPEEKSRRQKFRADRAPELHDLARKCRRWVMDNSEIIDAYDPAMPELKSSRAEDNWRMLVSLADLAGGDYWPTRAREIAVKLSGSATQTESEPLMLIRDIDACWGTKPVVKSVELTTKLQRLEGRPWPTLTPAKLASVLRAFPDGKGGHIRPTQHHRAGKWGNVYHLWQFRNAFARYARAADATPTEATPPGLFPTPEEVAAAVAVARGEADRKHAEEVAAYEARVAAWRAALVAKSDADRAKKAAEHDKRASDLGSTPSTPDPTGSKLRDELSEMAHDIMGTVIPPIQPRKGGKATKRPKTGDSTLLPKVERPPHLRVVPPTEPPEAAPQAPAGEPPDDDPSSQS